ncbi:MAG: imidazole glycerol phosphate synthase subunit HisH [Candidatus Limnocylindria bacterium]
MTLVVVNSGIGNLGAIPNMLHRIGAEAVISDDPEVIEAADKLILPGVGAFDAAAGRLRELELVAVLNRKVLEQHTPVLGLCLGMQLLAEESEEGRLPGLGWIPGRVRRFRFDPADDRAHAGAGRSLRVPHMGWNYVRAAAPTPLLEGLADHPRFYFAHSYYLACDDDADAVGLTTYGIPFASVVQRGNVYGAQFHPEKSHRFGLRFLENFVAL